ncbi:MAG: hypothetical protein NC337_07545 [Roseburia sp.]|nr:hypothetical protein [Roseburia sp.]
MFGNIDNMCKSIQDSISNMECKQCILLGIMGMARTVGLVKYIATHNEFQAISVFDTYIWGGIKKLYNDSGINMKISEGEDTCNALLLILQEEDYKVTNQQDEILMGIAYLLIENWYYFIGMLSLNIDNMESKRMARFLEVPSELIEEYLCCLYDVSSPSDKRIKEMQNDDMVKAELDAMEDDIKFVRKPHGYNDVEQRVNKYMRYKFWEEIYGV